jgi:hypothetical protein
MMPAAHADQIISGYLSRLEVAVRTLPGGRGAELLDVFREHIAEARAQLVDESDADLLNILDRLGDPAEIVAEERARLAVASPALVDSRNLVDVLAIVALLTVWPVGVVLLWISEAWSTRDKLIGTLLPPGGYLGVIFFEAALRGIPDIVRALFAVILVVMPLLTAIYLGLRLRRSGSRAIGKAVAGGA